MQASISLSLCLRRTRTRPSLWYRENRDSSLKIQCLHCLRSYTLCLLPHSWRRCLRSKVSQGHLAGRRDQYLAARSRLRMVRTGIRLPNRRIICIRRRGAKTKQFILTIQSSWRSSRGVEIFIEPPRFLWCGRPVSFASQNFAYASLRHPSILATSRLDLPSANKLTIRCSICCGKFCGMIPFKSSKKYHGLYRNPTLHKRIKVVMARETSLQVTTPELTFFLLLSLSGPQTIQTAFGPQFGYVMDRWNQNYFVLQLNILPETINADQIHTNAI